MPYALTLPLDRYAVIHVQQVEQALAGSTRADHLLQPSEAPCLTLAVFPDCAPICDIWAAVLREAETWSAIDLVLDAIGESSGRPRTVWLASVKSEALDGFHSLLIAALRGFIVHPYYLPDRWMPQITLFPKGLPSGARLEDALAAWGGEIHIRLEQLELVRLQPLEILQVQALRSSVSTHSPIEIPGPGYRMVSDAAVDSC